MSDVLSRRLYGPAAISPAPGAIVVAPVAGETLIVRTLLLVNRNAPGNVGVIVLGAGTGGTPAYLRRTLDGNGESLVVDTFIPLVEGDELWALRGAVDVNLTLTGWRLIG